MPGVPSLISVGEIARSEPFDDAIGAELLLHGPSAKPTNLELQA